MATLQPRAAAFSAPAHSHLAGLPEEPDFFASFGDSSALPQFDLARPLPELSSPPTAQQQQQHEQPQHRQQKTMDLRAMHFDPAVLDQLIASSQAFLPDIGLPSALDTDFSSFGAPGAGQNNADNDLDLDQDHYSAGSSPGDDHSHTSGDAPLKMVGGVLVITEEEREMLATMNIVIPTDALTLTKAEEKALKSVRRRLRNKISAQDSRRKKKEYVDGLEQRVASCTAVNIEMQSKVSKLATENRTLRQQLQHFKEMVQRLGGPQAATTGTLLMVLALSFSMFVNPLASSVAANATSELPLPGPGSRTLKALPHTSSFPVPMASLRDVLSNWLFESRRRDDHDDDDDGDQQPPSLAPLKRTVRAGGP